MYITKRFVFTAIASLIVVGCLFSIFGRYKTDILKVRSAIQDIAIRMRNRRYSIVLMCLIDTICGIPPIFGFISAVTMTGFIYGFPNGCIPATIGAFLSSIISFGLIRKLGFAKWIKLSHKRQEMYQAMQDAISHGGFKIILLIRICPLPWQLTNLVLSLVPTVSWKSYVLSAFISCFRFSLDVWIGSQLADLSNPDIPPEARKVTFIFMGIGLVVLISSGIWIYRLTMQKIKEQQEALLLEEGDERQRLLNRSENGSLLSYCNSEEDEEDGDSTTIIVGSTYSKIKQIM